MTLPDLNRQLIRFGTINVFEGPKLNFYHYATKSTDAEILTAGHFNFGRNYLKPGDRITAFTEAHLPTDSKDVALKVLTVPATGNVTVEDMTPDGGGGGGGGGT